MRFLKRLEVFLLVVGTVLMATYLAVRVDGAVGSRLALMAFQIQAGTTAKQNPQGGSLPVDFSLWSRNRITAYKNVIGAQFAAPLAILSVPRLQSEVPVFDGVDEIALNRGAGRIPGTARVGTPGNLGIAAHRDGFFRVLKDIKVGDAVELRLPDGEKNYAVTSTEIVSPEDVSVLAPRSRPAVTLVTCYPFYFVGDAPQRFIVHAEESEVDFFHARHTKLSSAVSHNQSQENQK
jgi:sortase A